MSTKVFCIKNYETWDMVNDVVRVFFYQGQVYDCKLGKKSEDLIKIFDETGYISFSNPNSYFITLEEWREKKLEELGI